MFEHLRTAIAEQRDTHRLRGQPSRRLTDDEMTVRAVATEAPRWKVLTNDAGKYTLLWEVAPGWYQHAWGNTPALLISDTEQDATAHVYQDVNLMTGTVNKNVHPDWTADDWERERQECNGEQFDDLEAAGFNPCQDSDWRN